MSFLLFNNMVTTVYRNDTGFVLNFTIKDTSDTVENLTSSYVTFKMSSLDSGVNKISATCAIVATTSGTCRYTASSGDFDTIGVYDGELQITFTSGKVVTADTGTFNVIEDLPA